MGRGSMNVKPLNLKVVKRHILCCVCVIRISTRHLS